MSEFQPIIPGARDISNADYHADTTHLSHSSLDVFGESRELYYARYIAKTIEHPGDTKAMALGSCLHAFTLQPDIAAGLFVSPPDADRRTKDGKARWAEFVEDPANAKKCQISKGDYETARTMADKLWAIPDARALLEAPGWCEQSVFVEVEEAYWLTYNGLEPDRHVLPGKFKAQFDKVFETGHICDVKTSRYHDFEGFQRDFFSRGYHRQGALYQDVHDIARGPHHGTFYYLVVCNEPPHEAFVRPASQKALDAGRIQNHRWIEEYNQCAASGNWSNEDRYPGELELPGWAYKKIEGR